MPPVLQLLLIALVITACVYDIRVRRIPNWLVLAGLVIGLGLNLFLFGWPGLKSSLLGVGLAALIYFPLYLLRGMGAGDVKLMAAVGALVGPAPWFVIFVITSIVGGLAAVTLLVARGRVARTLWNLRHILDSMLHLRAPYEGRQDLDVRSESSMRLPHGAFIALGSIVFIALGRFLNHS
jgi:prepilin peptidase CpaA